MEFKEMQIIWDNQNEEKLFAINEAAMYEQIKRKGKSITRKLDFVEMLMIGLNIVVGIALVADAINDNETGIAYILPVMYLAYAVIGLIRRLRRQKEAIQFEPTLVGELDKAISQIDYLIKEERSMIIWYLIPLVFVALVTLIIQSGRVTLLILAVLLALPVGYYGGKWEINKIYMPKKTRIRVSTRDVACTRTRWVETAVILKNNIA